jgi:hypothetical protein
MNKRKTEVLLSPRKSSCNGCKCSLQKYGDLRDFMNTEISVDRILMAQNILYVRKRKFC